jgi:hypothetical protein
MIFHARAEHIELTLISSADNIDGMAAMADVIDHASPQAPGGTWVRAMSRTRQDIWSPRQYRRPRKSTRTQDR